MNLRGAAGGAAPRQAGRMPAGRRSPARRAKAVTPHLAGHRHGGWPRREVTPRGRTRRALRALRWQPTASSQRVRSAEQPALHPARPPVRLDPAGAPALGAWAW